MFPDREFRRVYTKCVRLGMNTGLSMFRSPAVSKRVWDDAGERGAADCTRTRYRAILACAASIDAA